MNASSSSKRYVSLAQGGGASSSSGNALGQQSSAIAGSNKAQWNAMDLHIGSGARFQQQIGGGYNTRSSMAAGNVATGSSPAMKVDDSGLSARNILIRRKLTERKRFDSADYAMNKRQEEVATPGAMSSAGGIASSYNSNSSIRAVDGQARFLQISSSNAQAATRAMPTTTNVPFSPAQVGASVFFSALGGDENVDMDAKSDPAQTNNTTSNTGNDLPNSKSYRMNAAIAAAARGASRYGNLPGPAGGALSARNILLQKKLREKKHFDSADWQLAQIQSASPSASSTDASPLSSTDGNSSVGGDKHDGASPMEIDLTPVADPVESINSPSAASVALRNRVNAQMSPSVRGGKYGNGMSGANVLLARKLSEKKRFDSADYHMEAAPVAAAKAKQNFFVTATTSNAPEPPATSASNSNASVSAPPAPQVISSSTASGAGSKYGKLSAVNVLIRKKLKERKRFDSADYAMEKQGRHQPPNGDQGGSSGALQGGHVVMRTPMAHSNVYMDDASSSQAAEENKSINHQVKHIKLSEEGGGWSTRVPAAVMDPATESSSSFSAAMPKSSAAMSQDSRLAARNLIIQRKLSERKRFDSADYFKEVAKRSHS